MRKFLLIFLLAAFLLSQGYALAQTNTGKCCATKTCKCAAGTCCVKEVCKCPAGQCCTKDKCLCGKDRGCKGCGCLK